ncbi:hypothetical protein [Enterococcus sp. AZ109]|uniref:hypothetical protein n=1 Tax=Enterococcus sp. AZ109 TaxID=2774634 RepID=UPI003F29663C
MNSQMKRVIQVICVFSFAGPILLMSWGMLSRVYGNLILSGISLIIAGLIFFKKYYFLSTAVPIDNKESSPMQIKLGKFTGYILVVCSLIFFALAFLS